MKTIQKKWFHATTKGAWKKIQKDGYLLGPTGEMTKPCTFLARNLEELTQIVKKPVFLHDLVKCELILTVKYTPNNIDDDYNPKCWEMIVYKPIYLKDIKVLKYL